MAIFKMTNMNSTAGANPSMHLRNALNYVLDPKKCDFSRLAGAKNCVADAEPAYKLMMQTKKAYGKLHGRQGYHYIMSFEENSDTLPPETALEITEKFVDRYLQGRYEVVYAVHTDTDHVHSHIVFNSVAFDDGYKYHAPKGEWENAIMPIVYELCEEYGLSQIRFDKAEIDDNTHREDPEDSGGMEPQPAPCRTKTPPNPKYGRKGSGYGGNNACLSAMIRRDIDECIGLSDSMAEFYRLMEARGYRLRIGGNRSPGLQHESMERIRRFSSLGEGYSLEEIEAAILHGETPEPEPGLAEETLPEGFEAFDEARENVQATLHREVRLRFQMSGEAYSRASVYSRAEYCIVEFERIREAYEFVHAHNIHSMEDIDRLHDEVYARWRNAKNGLRSIQSKMKHGWADGVIPYAEEYRALSDAVALYRSGDTAFFEEYQKAERLKDKIKNCGYTVSEAMKIYEDFQAEVDRLKKEQENASTTLRQISRVKSVLKNETPREVVEKLEQNEAERRRTAERLHGRRL